MNTTEGLAPLCACFENIPMQGGDWAAFYRKCKSGRGDFSGVFPFRVVAVQPSLVKERLQSIARGNRVARGIIRKKMRKCMLDSF